MKVNSNYRFVLVFALIGHVYCQSLNDLDVNDLQKNLQESGIPGAENFNVTSLPKTEEVEKVLKEKCKKNGNEDAVDALKTQQDAVKTCVEQHVNVTQVQEELEVAKQTGSMDEVFGKYCKRWPEIYSCVENVTTTVRLCMNEKEVKAFNKSLDIMMELQEFMCYKDGDRLAMFVAEGGVECMQERKEGVQNCVNSTVGSRLPDTDDLSVANLPTFLFTDEDCADFDTIRTCVNKELEKCSDSTPANIVDAFLKFLKKHMPCDKPNVDAVVLKSTQNHTSTATGIASSVAFIASFVLYSLLF